MNDISPQARALIQAARAGEEPTDADRARIRRALTAQLGAAAFAAGVAATTEAGATAAAAIEAAGTGTGGLIKVAVVAGLIGALATGAAVALLEAVTEPAAPAARASGESGALPTAPAAAPGPAEPGPQPAADKPAGPSAAPALPGPESRASKAGAASSSAASGSQAAEPPDGLTAELDLLREAQRQLSRGNAAEAMQILEQHRSSFGDGALAEERHAARIFALCQLGKTDQARAEAALFLQRWPSSPLAERVRSECPGPASPSAASAPAPPR